MQPPAVWRLMKTSLVCGVELLSVSYQVASLTSQDVSIQLHILQTAGEVWQAQLLLKLHLFLSTPEQPQPQFSKTAVSTAEHRRQLPNKQAAANPATRAACS